jgi:hypothetical protein
MPLSPPVGRQHLHTRKVTCQGFYRDDGLWDIEGRITDEKTYEHANEWRGPLKAGDLVHDMSIRLTLDHRFTIDPVYKERLLKGLGEVGMVLQHVSEIEAFERRHHAEHRWLA